MLHRVHVDTTPRRRWLVITECDVAAMVANQAELRHCCDRLEAYADRLPDAGCDAGAAQVCREMTRILECHEVTCTAALDTIFGPESQVPLARVLMARIRYQHVANRLHAHDLLAALQGTDNVPSRDAVGYMMRCLFEGCRSAINFEELTLLVLGGDRLTTPVRGQVRGHLQRSLQD